MKDEATPPQYEALVHIGYVYSDQQYIAFWTGTFGAKFAGVGRGTRTGNSVEFRFGQPEVTFFNTFTWVPERQEWVLRMETPNASGGRSLFAIDTFSARFGRIMEPDGNRVELRQPPEGQWSSVAKTAIQPIAEPGARPSLQSITEFKT
jgi:hypothetical protein